MMVRHRAAALLPPPFPAAPSPSRDSVPILRAVEVHRLNVFSPSEARSFLPRLANRLHITTRAWVVERELLFGPGSRYDSARVAETAPDIPPRGGFPGRRRR